MPIIPPFLQPGDTIAIACTARSVNREQILDACAYMESLGFNIFTDESLFESYGQYGGDDLYRAERFNRLLSDPEIKAIWCARGGYGTARMIDGIDFELLKRNPKWIAGFSDVTVLLNQILKVCNMASLHSTMPIFMHGRSGEERRDVEVAIESLSNALQGNFETFRLNDNATVNKADFSGRLCGGNLSVLYSIIGSVSEPVYTDSVLFLEDLDEYYYHIDRMMVGLKRAGRLKELRAILVGSFTSMHDNNIPFGSDVRGIISEHCSGYGYPVIFDVDAGHHLRNLCLPFGLDAVFKNGILTFAAK